MRPQPESIIEQLGISHTVLTARGLREYTEARNLALAETGADGREYLLIPAAAAAWRDLRAAATEDGAPMFLASAFRSVVRQNEIIREKLAAGLDIGEIITVCAPPGFSEHHTGRAVDIVCPDVPDLQSEFEDTQAFQWLVRNAAHFGFTLSYPRGNAAGYQYEPWHWCFHDAASGLAA